jgi:chromosome segregation ATPase
MKIRKFFEQDENVDISNDRIKEILEQLTTISSDLDTNRESIISLTNELSNYRSKSKTSNDQIDDSVSNFEQVKENISTIISLLDTISKNLKDYDQSGRRYLY